MSEWQPIETAPKARRIFVLVDGRAFAASKNRFGWYVDLPGDKSRRPVSPTHWMPLPEPPK